jgi:hypothetical protein
MATTQNSGMNEPRSYPEYYDNARDYVLDHLHPHEPRSPAEMAEAYGCGGDHMRGTLADLAESGEIERVSRGQYVLPDGEADAEPGDDMESNGDDTTLPGPDAASTAELYQQQHTQDNADEEHADAEDGAGAESVGADDTADDADADDLDAAPAAALPMDPKTLGTVLALALGVWLAYRAVGGSDTSEPEPEPDAGGEQADDTDDMDGGLLG